MRVSTIELETFNDMVFFLYSRLTTMSLNTSLLCNEKSCFTIISASEELIFVITSPPPERPCRYAYIDDTGRVICTENPLAGRPSVFIVRVKNIRETGSIVDAVSSTKPVSTM